MNRRTLLLTLLCLGLAMPADARRAREGNYWIDTGAKKSATYKKNNCDPCKPKPCPAPCPKPCPDPCKPDPCYDPCQEDPCDEGDYNECGYSDCDDDCDDEHDYDDCDDDDCDYDDCDEDPCHKDTCKDICVTSCDDSGCGTLRWALEQACAEEMCNIDGSVNIVFNLDQCEPCYDSTNHLWQITLEKPLEVTCPVCIDGYSQCGAKQNTMLTARENTAKIKIEIKASDQFPVNQDGITFLAGSEGSVLRGVSIGGFDNPKQSAVCLAADNITVAGSYLSIRPDGETLCANTIDIKSQSNNNTIGGESVCDAVLFAGNGQNGGIFADAVRPENINGFLGAIYILGQNTVMQNVSGGIDRAGTVAINPTGKFGVVVNANPPVILEEGVEVKNLTMKNCAIAGYAEFCLYSDNFDGIHLEYVSIGTTRQQDAIINGGTANGIYVTHFLPLNPPLFSRGTFKFVKGVISGTAGAQGPLTIGDIFNNLAKPITSALIDQVLVGTNGPATTNPGTVNLGNQQPVRVSLTKKLDVNNSIFSASAQTGFLLAPVNEGTKFFHSVFGSGRAKTENNLGNAGVGLDILTGNMNNILIEKCFGKYNDAGGNNCDLSVGNVMVTLMDSNFAKECL